MSSRIEAASFECMKYLVNELMNQIEWNTGEKWDDTWELHNLICKLNDSVCFYQYKYDCDEINYQKYEPLRKQCRKMLNKLKVIK